jgi:4-diphosphocytidyl-2-C-methyl-D-erythritol kinase
MRLFSPAKLNLFFRVLGKRVDGYHEIASLFQAINLGDFLTFDIIKGEDRLVCSDSSLPCDESNLVFRALRLFREKTKESFGLRVFLEKRIPIEAGLGGGSSNAATTLSALNALRKTSIEEKQLQCWGAELGSDVPFFFSRGTAYCTGRGEIVTEISRVPPLSGWIARPLHKGLSTALVYQKHTPQVSHDAPFFNDLEPAAFALMPQLLQLKKELRDFGFDQVSMTGSGSAFFCLGKKTTPSLSGVEFIPFQSVQRERWYEFL